MKPYYNKNLREAFDLYVREQDALLPDEEELSAITLSPAYHEKMKRLLTLRKRGFYVFFGTVGRRVASILIAVVLALTSATVRLTRKESMMARVSNSLPYHSVVKPVNSTPLLLWLNE